MAATGRPPFRPDPEKQAREVANRLTERLAHFEAPEAVGPYEAHYPLMADVDLAIEEIENALRFAAYAKIGVPCIEDGEDTVPIVGLPMVGSTVYKRFPPGYFAAFSYFTEPYFNEYIFRNMGVQILRAEPSDVPKMVLSPLTKFLAVRFRWAADNPEFRSLGAAASAQANNPYLPFTVHTNTAGLRIHYSKTFAINFNNVFGAPTTPVSGWILPGIHKFAGMDKSGKLHIDKGTFTTPPDFSARLMI